MEQEQKEQVKQEEEQQVEQEQDIPNKRQVILISFVFMIGDMYNRRHLAAGRSTSLQIVPSNHYLLTSPAKSKTELNMCYMLKNKVGACPVHKMSHLMSHVMSHMMSHLMSHVMSSMSNMMSHVMSHMMSNLMSHLKSHVITPVHYTARCADRTRRMLKCFRQEKRMCNSKGAMQAPKYHRIRTICCHSEALS